MELIEVGSKVFSNKCFCNIKYGTLFCIVEKAGYVLFNGSGRLAK